MNIIEIIINIIAGIVIHSAKILTDEGAILFLGNKICSTPFSFNI